MNNAAANEIAKRFGVEIQEIDGMAPGTDAILSDKARDLCAALNAAGIAAKMVRGPLAMMTYVELVVS